MNLYQQIERLSTEWREHGNLIIMTDYDDTIFPFKSASQEDCDTVIKLLKDVRQTGAYIVVHTCSNPDRYKEITEYCESKGLIIDGINKNPIDLPYGNQGKPYGNIYLDDRAGLNETLSILEIAMYKQRGYLEQQKLMKSDLD